MADEEGRVEDGGTVELNGQQVALLGAANWHRHDVTVNGVRTQVAHDVHDESCEHPESLIFGEPEAEKGPDPGVWGERVDEVAQEQPSEPTHEVKGPDPDQWGQNGSQED